MADVVIGGDLVVTASNKILETMRPDETAVVVSTHEMTTGEFTRNPNLAVPGSALRQAIQDRVRKGIYHGIDAHEYAVKLFGDSIASNMFLLGYAYQLGVIPIGAAAIETAIELNGAAVDMNRQAFRFGRLAAHEVTALERIVKPASDAPVFAETLADIVARRAEHLAAYQDEALATRYRRLVDRVADIESQKVPGRTGLAEAVAKAYHKLLSYKDEYEVARLYTDGTFEKQVAEKFDGVRKIEFHLAPPLLAWFHKDKTTGHPRKIKLGPWMLPVFRMLAKGKSLRGTAWDVFGYTAERRLERRMIGDYERLVDEIVGRLTSATHPTAVALASLPLDVKGFGHVKLANYETAKKREADLRRALANPPPPVRIAAE
jgi:indolepyruvate ferredoxin oxidoreductase